MRRALIIVASALLAEGALAQRLTVRDQADTKAIAVQRGWLIRQVAADGRTVELQAIVNGMPRYYVSYNLGAADSVASDECWPGGSGGLSLTGSDITNSMIVASDDILYTSSAQRLTGTGTISNTLFSAGWGPGADGDGPSLPTMGKSSCSTI